MSASSSFTRVASFPTVPNAAEQVGTLDESLNVALARIEQLDPVRVAA